MRSFPSLLRRFQSDERGAFLVLFGVLAIVLVATSGAVVDYTAIEQSRTRAQVALDAAALGLQPQIYSETNDELKNQSEDLLVQQLNTSGGEGWTICDDMAIPPCVRVDAVTTDTAEGTLRLEAMLKMPTSFVALIGFPSIQAKLISEATRKKLNLEVAMVLDNSGSMASRGRMINLKIAAINAVKILFGGAASQPNVFVGVVPFTEFVNVGTSNSTATWMDQLGTAGISNDNFDNDDYDGSTYAGPVNRLALFANLTGVSWKGCVEARVPPYDTDDTVPTIANPNSLFTPAFAPDEPDRGYYNSYIPDKPASCTNKEPKWVWTQTKYSCDRNANNSKSNYDRAICDGPPPTNLYQKISELGVVTATTSTRPSSIFNNPDPGANSYTDTYRTIAGGGSNRTNQRVRTWTYKFSDRELQERICKYAGAVVPSSTDGPNVDCPRNALLPLTNKEAAVKGRIAAMVPDGGTNIHQGVIWGFHMLSPTPPLTEATDYDSTTSKVMIIMTDGENTHSYSGNMNKASWYVAYGYPYNGRLTGSSTRALQAEMNKRTLTTCTNAKAAGITIYTIGLNSPNMTTTTMLTNCASDSSKAYFPTVASQLDDVFKDIANQLSNLRLAK
ncbi:MAG: pilus assembly protein TadG-related protein [Devosia sp.]